MREIILDTETTGLDPAAGHRIVEIGCVESINHIPAGGNFHRYVNPERDMPEEAFRIHGLGTPFLAEQPVFAAVVDDFLAFIGDDALVIHNASFDMKFLNAELSRLGRPAIDPARAIDTVTLARRRYPGAQVSLDALCRRFEIDLSVREKHGALLDAELLAEVYLELRGGRQPDLAFAGAPAGRGSGAVRIARPIRPPRPHTPSEAERSAHGELLAALTAPIWLR
jgi:DNA polymerase-3 subunit epsilon